MDHHVIAADDTDDTILNSGQVADDLLEAAAVERSRAGVSDSPTYLNSFALCCAC